MAPRVRWVKTLEQVKGDAERSPEFLSSVVRSLRVVYETDPPRAAAVLPRPLVPAPRPEVCVTFSHVAMQLAPEVTFEIGSAIFGVRALHEGEEGIWLLTMPMTTEQAVIGGRETWGEPKKIARIDFQLPGPEAGEGAPVSAAVTRMGVTYLEARGRLGAALGPRRFTEHGFCVKALPACEKGRGLDGDPLLVRLDWHQDHRRVHRVEGELLLRESAFDPVADLPVRRLVRMEYEEGTSQSGGRVLRALPPEWVLPVLHQRYDDPGAEGVEVSAAC
jgi:acetoacetate decarboxylase